MPDSQGHNDRSGSDPDIVGSIAKVFEIALRSPRERHIDASRPLRPLFPKALYAAAFKTDI